MKALITILLVTAAHSAVAWAPITVLYEERPPYQVRVGNAVEGLVAGRASEAFKAAGIPFVWQYSSMSRQLHMLREGTEEQCVVGMFKNAERASFARYTKPVFRDAPIAAIVRSQFQLGSSNALSDVLAAPGLRVLVRGKYSYGPKIDQALATVKPMTISSPLNNLRLAELIRAGRGDLMFAAEDELAVLLKQSADGLQVIRFSDADLGEGRHIVCSRKVPDEIIERLNKVIDADH